jgi:hypothetical protein
MEGLLILIFLLLIGAGVAVYLRGRSRERVASGGGSLSGSLPAGSPPTATGTAGDLRNLRIGDVVHWEDRDWIVEGTLRLDQGGFVWQEHRIVDGSDSHWLSVEDDEGLEVVLWDRLRGATLEPGAGSIAHEGVDYELDERGHANFTSEGVTGAGGGGRMEFADYAAGDRRLSFERFGDEAGWEISVGTVISEHQVDVYPSREAHG